LLEDGRILETDIVVMAVGIRPNTALAPEAGLTWNRGIVVNDQMKTADPDVFAIGECVEHRDQVYGLVAPLYDMAKVAAANLLGHKDTFEGVETSTKLKVTGVDLFSAGDFQEGEGREEIVFRDATRGVYKRVVLEDNRIIGVVMYGDTADGSWFFQKLKAKEDISELRDTLIFGPN
ncbi:MAG: FAD-dependent oxidoreductase, partial [Pseudomonadota bacterium]